METLIIVDIAEIRNEIMQTGSPQNAPSALVALIATKARLVEEHDP